MSFIQELKRRNVAKVAVLYAIVAWIVLQIAELLFEVLGLPDEWLKLVLALFMLGFPIALIFSWVFEITPEGVKREKDIDRDSSIAPQTGQRINVVIIVLLVVAVATVVIDRLMPKQAAEPVAAIVEEAVVEEGAAENSIAVLPFADLSADGDQEYFSDGIAEEILNVLVRIDGLEVASRTTSFGFKGQESLGIPFIAEKMSVRHVLEGSVRKAGDTVRITAQLIDAQSDKHLWSETYDRTLSAESIFEIQDEIAGAIVEQLGALMNTSGGGSTSRAAADTQDLEAYELYLLGHKLFIERSDVARSIEVLELAVEKDPGFARAWAALAAGYFVAPGWVGSGRDYEALAKNAANTAIEINPDLALPYAVLGGQFSLRSPLEFDAGFKMFEEALLRDPKETTTYLWRGIANGGLGYFDLAIADFRRCLEIDPAYRNCRRFLSATLLFNGEEEAAEEQFERGLYDGFVGSALPFNFYYAEKGNKLSVLYELAYNNRVPGDDELNKLIYAAIVDRDFEFEDVRSRVEAMFKVVAGRDIVWSDSSYYSFVFKNYEAINDQDLSTWWFPYPDNFRQSAQAKALIQKVGFDDHWREHGFPPQCRAVGADDFACDQWPAIEKRPSGSGLAPH
jgi:adenylate cyclase